MSRRRAHASVASLWKEVALVQRARPKSVARDVAFAWVGQLRAAGRVVRAVPAQQLLVWQQRILRSTVRGHPDTKLACIWTRTGKGPDSRDSVPAGAWPAYERVSMDRSHVQTLDCLRRGTSRISFTLTWNPRRGTLLAGSWGLLEMSGPEWRLAREDDRIVEITAPPTLTDAARRSDPHPGRKCHSPHPWIAICADAREAGMSVERAGRG